MFTWSCNGGHDSGGVPMQAPALHPFPDMTEPRLAYPMYQEQEYDRRYAVRMHDVYMQVLICFCTESNFLVMHAAPAEFTQDG